MFTFGIEWEPPLLLLNPAEHVLVEKIPYEIDEKITFSVESFPHKKTKIDKEHCLNNLEFILGVFDTIEEFNATYIRFNEYIQRSFCMGSTTINVTDSLGNIIPLDTVIIETVKPGKSYYKDCNAKRFRPGEPIMGQAVLYGNLCPLSGALQITIGTSLEDTYKLYAYMVNLPMIEYPPIRWYQIAFKVAGYVANRIGLTGDPEIDAICFTILYVIISYQLSQLRSDAFSYYKAAFALKPRTNITCMLDMLSKDKYNTFMVWYNNNKRWIEQFYTVQEGYIFTTVDPLSGIDARYVYSTDIVNGRDATLVGNTLSKRNYAERIPGMNVEKRNVLIFGDKIMSLKLQPNGPQIVDSDPTYKYNVDINEWCTLGSSVIEIRGIELFMDNPRAGNHVRIENLQYRVNNIVNNLENIFSNSTDTVLLAPEKLDEYFTHLKLSPKFELVARNLQNNIDVIFDLVEEVDIMSD